MILHDVFAAANALRIFLDCQFLGCPFEAEKAFDVQLGTLLKAGPLGVFRMNGVEADLVDHHPVGERLVPGVDGQGSVLLVQGVSLPEDEVVDAHDLLQEVGGFDEQFGSAVNDVKSVDFVDVLVDDFGLFDDRDHLAGRKPHLVGLHHQLERLLVDSDRRLILLNHLEAFTWNLDVR